MTTRRGFFGLFAALVAAPLAAIGGRSAVGEVGYVESTVSGPALRLVEGEGPSFYFEYDSDESPWTFTRVASLGPVRLP